MGNVVYFLRSLCLTPGFCVYLFDVLEKIYQIGFKFYKCGKKNEKLLQFSSIYGTMQLYIKYIA